MATSTTTVIPAVGKCKPFLLNVMVFSPESGYKFTIEVQKACDSQNQPVWKLLFDLYKKKDADFVEVVSVQFVAGDPNDISKIAAITSSGMTHPQVQAFRQQVYPLVKPLGDNGQTPSADDQKKIDATVKSAIHAS